MYSPRAVTLAIPCRNAARFIGATLVSVGKLDPAPDEVIVVDDGSTDESMDIVSRFPNVRRIRHGKNLGIASARNTALDHAENEVVVFIDADVIAHRRLVSSLLRHYVDDRVAGVGGRGLEVHREGIYDRWRTEILFQGWGERFLPGVPFLFGLCSSYRRDIAREVGGFNVAFAVSGEDMDISFRLRKEGYLLCYDPEAVVEHMRLDDKDSLEKMTYRHCFWGFVAQRLNRCYDRKVSIGTSVKTLLRQILVDGIIKGVPKYAGLTIVLHRVILRAWIDSGRYLREHRPPDDVPGNGNVWEGHGIPPPEKR